MYYFIVKIDEITGKPKLYNKDNKKWFDFKDGKFATMFSSRNKAERLIKKMINTSHCKSPLFLITGRVA